MHKSPPTTFRRIGVTINDKQDGQRLTLEQQASCALSLAYHHRTHTEAIASIIAHGLAPDAAEADSLIYAAESKQN